MSSRSFPKSSARNFRHGLLLTAAGAFGLSAATTAAYADAPSVVTTIKPLHSIASAVMEGVGTPHILIDGASSPHGFALKPSQAFLLQGADVVFWVGPELAPSLAKPITSMASNAKTVELLEAPGIHQLDIREGANFDAHDHDHEDGHDHDEAHHDEHEDHEEHADHDEDHEEHADHDDHDEDHEEHDEAHEHGHEHGEEHDPHIWLNPDNGIAIAGVMAETLAGIDPEHAATYRENAAKFKDRIEKLEQEVETQMEPVSGKTFIVFHDAYHHFEHRFGVEASGAITLSPEALSSADRIAHIRERIKDLNVTCVFQEPQFEAKLVDVAMEGSSARKATLDPLGTEIDNGPDLYPELLKNLADSLSGCLDGHS